jgi:hypothetical protein
MTVRCRPVAWAVFLASLFALPSAAASPLAGETTPEGIQSLIRDLGDPSYEKRTFATRRLCAIGMPAHAALTEAARSGEFETAQRARKILETLDDILFAGVEVALTVSKPTIAWNETLDLTVRLANRSSYPARVPFELSEGKRTAASREARQVGDLLDLADWLRIVGPAGEVVDLRVDDFTGSVDVQAAVDMRLAGGPVSVIDPGQDATLIIGGLNRGWARYPLLDSGAYSLRFDYAPDWNDEVLNARRVGRVVSDTLAVQVRTPAPDTISRRGAEASLAIERSGDMMTASLVNRSDLPVWVNKNFGPTPPFAQARWVISAGEARHALPVPAPVNPALADFHADRLIELPPGESLELAGIRIESLHQAVAGQRRRRTGEAPAVHFSYSNVCDRRWQGRPGADLSNTTGVPPILQNPLPRRMLATILTSPYVRLPDAP